MRIEAGFLRVATWITLVALPAMPSHSQQPTPGTTEADIVFVGEVEVLGAASFAEVPEPHSKVVVKVESVLTKPEAVSLAPGSLVTLAPRGLAPKKGTRATFYTRGWIYGQGVAVQELRRDEAPKPVAGAALQSSASLRQAQENVRLQAAITQADAVLIGRVVAIHAPAAKATAAPTPITPITEHDPAWREAVVQVKSWLKGGDGSDQVVVRFPSSLDVAWYDAPKLKQGQEGTFLLQQDRVTGQPLAVIAGRQVRTFTALHAMAVRPVADAAKVRALLSPR